MTELLAWDGPWSLDLILSMDPVVNEIAVERERSWFNAAQAAIGSIFGKAEVGTNYLKSLDKTVEAVRNEQRALRGGAAPTKEDRRASAAQKLVDAVMKAKGIKNS